MCYFCASLLKKRMLLWKYKKALGYAINTAYKTHNQVFSHSSKLNGACVLKPIIFIIQ